MNAATFVKYFFIILLLVIFAYQSWKTVSKYLERKTMYQITTKDDDNILFPSITFCKKFMYTQRDFLSLFQNGKVEVQNAKEYFKNVTLSRSELVTFLNMNTIEGSNSFPCNTLTGLRPGAPCTFPYVFPDCSLSFKSSRCPNTTSQSFQRCQVHDDIHSCYTRTYLNGSAILGRWGDCRPAANCSSSVSLNSPVYNLTSSLYGGDWYEGVYGLENRASQHCHTFNPRNVSLPGPRGQLYAYLGLPSTSLLTDFTRAFDIYLHERNQFWPGNDMERVGQTKNIDLELNNEIWGTFSTSQIKKLNKAEEPCVEQEDYSLTTCLMEFVASSTGCYLDWGQTFRSDISPPCRSLQEIIKAEQVLYTVSRLSWNKLTEKSGCYGKCRYKKFTFTEVKITLLDFCFCELLLFCRAATSGSAGGRPGHPHSSCRRRPPGSGWRRSCLSSDLRMSSMELEELSACS